MGIEIVLGLPSLRRGALFERACAMRLPVMVSANGFSRWHRRDGWREWAGWCTGPLACAHDLASVDLDSAGYVLAVRERGIPWSVEDYIALAASFPFRRFASLDLCCEPEIAHDREEVLDRIARTVRLNRLCHRHAVDAGIGHRLMPVIQGRRPEDYLRSFDGIADIVRPGGIVGVGSMCRRHVHGADGLLAVLDRLDRALPRGVRLHGFGVKGAALSWLTAFGDRIASVDSQAYGVAARREAFAAGVPKTDAFVAGHMVRWTHRQFDRLKRVPDPRQIALGLAEPDAPPSSPWERALGAARAEIRALIEEGEIAHDQITAGWVAEWATELIDA